MVTYLVGQGSVVHQSFHCAVLDDVHGGLARIRRQMQHGLREYRCCRHPMEHHQCRLPERVGSQAYADGLVDGLVVGFSVGIGGIWRFKVCVRTPLRIIWTLCKAQSTSSRLQHCIVYWSTTAVSALLNRWSSTLLYLTLDMFEQRSSRALSQQG